MFNIPVKKKPSWTSLELLWARQWTSYDISTFYIHTSYEINWPESGLRKADVKLWFRSRREIGEF